MRGLVSRVGVNIVRQRFCIGLLVILSLGMVQSGGAWSATCPLNTLALMYGGREDSSAPSRDTTLRENGEARVYYDAPGGRLGAATWESGTTYANAMVAVEDDYAVFGPSAGMPVALTAHLHLTGSAILFATGGSTESQAIAQLREGSSNERTVTFTAHCFSLDHCHSYAANEDIELPISTTTGSTFRLRFEISSYSRWASGNLSGLLSFTGLPPGVCIESCQGFGNCSVPVRRTGWGELKVRYR